jgi:hypothetical protein
MSTLPDNEFDLEKLFLPAWAQQEASANKYSKYEGEEERPERRGDRRGPRPPRRDAGPRREGPPAQGREDGRPRQDRRGPRPEGGRGRGPTSDRGEGRRGDPRERREPAAPLPEINLSLVPEEKGVESLARQIRMTGRAYPLFDIAQMILQKPERHTNTFSVKKNAEGKPVQPLFVCALDDTLWLSEDEAVAHVLKKHFNTFYQAERSPTEPPKGKYTFVAQCGLSGTILGPPNHHDYQNQLRKLHTERFSRMPFEVYKSRVRIVRDEEVVKKWIEDQSFKTEYLCLNTPESTKLDSMAAVEQHFRQTHKDSIIKPVESHTLSGVAARNLRSPELTRMVRSVWEDQRRFPLQIATVLSQQFAGHGLQFFKVNKTITHVSVARPHYLDMTATPVSEGVKRIVDYINAHPKCTRRVLIEALAPSPAPTPTLISAPAPAAAPPATGEPAATEAQAAPQAAAAQPAPQPETAEPTSEQTALVADLHWLVHEGHVIEFANGVLETAKKPLPKPPKPEPKPAPGKPAEPAVASEAAPGPEAIAPLPATETLAPMATESSAPETTAAAETAPAVEPVPPAESTPESAAQATSPEPESTPSAPSEPSVEPPSQP